MVAFAEFPSVICQFVLTFTTTVRSTIMTTIRRVSTTTVSLCEFLFGLVVFLIGITKTGMECGFSFVSSVQPSFGQRRTVLATML